MTKKLEFEVNKHLRFGQQLFWFLSWLHTQKKFEGRLFFDHVESNHVLADPFNIPDEQFEALWVEYNATMKKVLPK